MKKKKNGIQRGKHLLTSEKKYLNFITRPGE